MEYCDIHFVMAMQMLLSKNIEDVTPKGEFRLEAYLHVFTRQLLDNGCLPSIVVQSEREMVQMLNTREYILEMVQRGPRLSNRRMASRIGVSHVHVWHSVAWFFLYIVVTGRLLGRHKITDQLACVKYFEVLRTTMTRVRVFL